MIPVNNEYILLIGLMSGSKRPAEHGNIDQNGRLVYIDKLENSHIRD